MLSWVVTKRYVLHSFQHDMCFPGYEVKVKTTGMDQWLNFFIPESEIYNPCAFKKWLDFAYLRLRWKLQCNGKSWRDMIERRLGN